MTADPDVTALAERANDILANRREFDHCDRNECFAPMVPELAQDILALLALVERLQRENEELREVTRGRYGDVVERLQRELDRHTRAARGDGLPYDR
jgi:hypothetical protein